MDDDFNAFLAKQLGALSPTRRAVSPRQEVRSAAESSAYLAAEGLSSYQAAYRNGLSAFQRLQASSQSPGNSISPLQASSRSPTRPHSGMPPFVPVRSSGLDSSQSLGGGAEPIFQDGLIPPSCGSSSEVRTTLLETKGLMFEVQNQLSIFYEGTNAQLRKHQKELQTSLSDIRESVEQLRYDTRLQSNAATNAYPVRREVQPGSPITNSNGVTSADLNTLENSLRGLVRTLSAQAGEQASELTRKLSAEVREAVREDLQRMEQTRSAPAAPRTEERRDSKGNSELSKISKAVAKTESICTDGFVNMNEKLEELKNMNESTPMVGTPSLVRREERLHSIFNPIERKVDEMDLTEDPRKTLARFFRPGDGTGPHGAMKSVRRSVFGSVAGGVDAHAVKSYWFAVFRPCSSEAIQKMVFRDGCGKGLNVKGKSAKRGPLSGFVPFLQISDNLHKKQLSTPSRSSRLEIFYKTEEGRASALAELTKIRDAMVLSVNVTKAALEEVKAGDSTMDDDEEAEAFERLKSEMDDPSIAEIDDFPDAFGLEIPERLIKEAYILRPDLTHQAGWDTGRKSTPAFSNMNSHSLHDSNRGLNEDIIHTALLQYDNEDPMNPHGLVMAYATENGVHAVVSDFDCFTVAHKGMTCRPLSEEQQEMQKWMLKHTEAILDNPTSHSWSSRWLDVLKTESIAGFHPEVPKYGFGDPTSYGIMEKLVHNMRETGGVRHGAECFNFYFPQELDDEYLIIWEGFGEKKPWKYVSEGEVRKFCLERIAEDYSFPVNPAWPLRDEGWYDVLQALRKNPATCDSLSAWFPASGGILENIDRIRAKNVNGFKTTRTTSRSSITTIEKEGADDSAMENYDLGLYELRRAETLLRAKTKMRAFLTMLRIRSACRKAAGAL